MSTNTATAKCNETGSRRQSLNFWIDSATALAFAGLLGTGALMKWILPPGTCDAPALKTWLGHARHWWGDIHFWVAMGLFSLVLVHTYLHWNWVLTVWRKLVGGLASPRTWALGTALAALLAVPWLIPPAVVELPQTTTPRTTAQDAGVAPCGIPGLSCADCPAASDRLGGAPAPAATEDPCATCPEAGQCSDQACADDTAKTVGGTAATDRCADCPDADQCDAKAKQTT